MDTLESLFGSAARVKLLKLFLMNPETQFSMEAACRQASIKPTQFRIEAERLQKLKIIQMSLVRMAPPSKAHGHSPAKARWTKTKVFTANQDFPLFTELRMLMLKSAPHAKGQLAEKIKHLGNIKLAILSGVFIDNPTSRIDLLLVGDNFKRTRMNGFIRWLEAEFGKQLNYVAMSSQEYRYRVGMFDRFLRDILESPHEAVINKIGAGAEMG